MPHTLSFIPKKVWDNMLSTRVEPKSEKIRHVPGDQVCSITLERLDELAKQPDTILIAAIKDTKKIRHYYAAEDAVDWLKKEFKNPNNNLEATSVRFYRQAITHKQGEEEESAYVEVGKCKGAGHLDAHYWAARDTKLQKELINLYKATLNKKSVNHTADDANSTEKKATPSSKTLNSHTIPHATPHATPQPGIRPAAAIGTDGIFDYTPASRPKNQPASTQNLETPPQEDTETIVDTLFAAFESGYEFTHEEIFKHAKRFPTLVPLACTYYPELKQSLFNGVPEDTLENAVETAIAFIEEGAAIDSETPSGRLVVEFLLKAATRLCPENKEKLLAAIEKNPTRHHLDLFSLDDEQLIQTLIKSGADISATDPATGKSLIDYFFDKGKEHIVNLLLDTAL